MKFAALLIALVLGAEVKVNSPATAPVGVPVLVDASESIGDLEWSTPDKDVALFLGVNGARQGYVVGLKPGPRQFTIKAKDAAGPASSREVIIFTEEGGTAPAPSPLTPHPPGPDAKPKTLPAGKFSVSQPCCDRCCQIQAANRKAAAEALIAKLSAVRDRIKAGDISAENKPIVDAITSECRQLPVKLQMHCIPWCGYWWNELVGKAHSEKKLATSADWVLLFEETILGLKAVQ